MKFCFVDDIYPDAMRALSRSRPEHTTVQEARDWLSAQLFGTAGFWDEAVLAAGHDSTTITVNDEVANRLWTQWQPGHQPVWWRLIESETPDVVCIQNTGQFKGRIVAEAFPDAVRIAFCSHAHDPENLKGFHTVFTSFRWMAEENVTGNVEYMPLAFGRRAFNEVPQKPWAERSIPVLFVGGAGSRIWNKGTEVLARVAADVPGAKCYGYRVGKLPDVLERAWGGEKWGRDYYAAMADAKIVLNRHGEIARNFANNMRCFECPGMGALLLTDGSFEGWKHPISCGHYDTAHAAVEAIRWALGNGATEAEDTAKAGQECVLAHHTFEHRVPQLLAAVDRARTGQA